MRYGLIGVLALGCHGGSSGDEFAASTLEKSTVLVDQELPNDVRVDWPADITVGGSEPNWTLQLDATAANVTIEVHSAAHSDLSGLGLDGATVSVQPEPFSNELSLLVTDANGDLQYLVEPVKPGPLTQEVFGLGLLAPYDDLGSVAVDGWNLGLTGAVIRTDGGDQDLLPGQPIEATIGGDTYRVVLGESFAAQRIDPANEQCTGASDRLAFEMVRVDPGTADLSPLTRSEQLDIPTATCTPYITQ